MEDTTKASYNLDKVRLLESPEDYTDWLQGMTSFFVFSNLNYVIERQTTRPVQGQESAETSTRLVAVWDRKQELAQAGIRERIGYNGRTMVLELDNASQMMKALKSFYKPRGIGTFSELCKRFNEVKLTDFSSVTEYSEAFKRIDNELKALNRTLTLPEPFLIQK